MQLPNVSGYNLEREKMNFPADLGAPLNLVFIAFQRWHQDVIDGWVPFVAELSQKHSGLNYYEFPTLARGNLLYRTLLNEGMRAGIPNRATRVRTITLYLDKGQFRQALDIPTEQEVWLYLFDQKGAAIWRVAGPFTQEKGDALAAAVTHYFTNP
jgi:hypothetical protein